MCALSYMSGPVAQGGICRRLALVCEDFRQRGLEVDERGPVELDFSALTRPVKGAHADTLRGAVDDGLSELYARLAVLRGDGEGQVDDVGLCFTKCHDGHLSARERKVINAGAGLIPNLDYVYIIS